METPEHRPTPTITRVDVDGTLVELIFDPAARKTALAVGRSGEPPRIVEEHSLRSGEQLVPYRGDNNLIASGCVLLPSAIGPSLAKGDLLQEIETYLERYVDLSPGFRSIAAHYALLTWVYDAFHELPYLRFQGDYGTGKTRALLALGSICYKPFFASGASTVSPIFHVLDAFQGTLILDEADLRFSDATAPLTKILNNGNAKGLPVLRTMTNRNREFDPKAFQVFGPKVIAMRERFDDVALESRFVTEEMSLKVLRTDVPIHTPASLSVDALDLRNKLLTWRLMHRHTIAPNPSRLAPGLEPRMNQVSLALASLMDEPRALDGLHAHLAVEAGRIREDRAASPEGEMLSVLSEQFTTHTSTPVRVSVIAGAFGARRGSAASAKWTGWFLRTRLKIELQRSSGVFVVPLAERARIIELARRFGVGDATGSDAARPTPPTNRSRAPSFPLHDYGSGPVGSIPI